MNWERVSGLKEISETLDATIWSAEYELVNGIYEISVMTDKGRYILDTNTGRWDKFDPQKAISELMGDVGPDGELYGYRG